MAANSTSFRSNCEFHVPFKTDNGHTRAIDFINAPVAMPIPSVKRWKATGNRTILDEHDGEFIHNSTGERDAIVARNGVYFAKMIARKSLLVQPADQTLGRLGQN